MTLRRSLTLPCILALVAGFGLVVGTSGHSQAAGARQTTAPVGPAHYYVTAGWGTDDYAANIFTPRRLQIYVGDTVTWTVKGTLEPHTVTFGARATIGNLSRNSVMPVVQKNGPPQLVLNSRAALPTPSHVYGGAGFSNSGLLTPGRSWTLRFTRAGVYTYYCILHFPGMTGQIVVNPRPTASGMYVVRSGYGTDTSAADAFFPENLTIHVGNTVVWTPGFHTVSFVPLATAQQLRRQLVQAMPQKAGPPKLVLNPRIAFPSGGPTYGGVGVWSSGLLIRGPARLTFTRPGVYHYHCLIHPGMDGTITVVP